ncbi:MAG: energy transducer TonB [Crocinitomicaceae bacterium]|nr:energy transducer TonB [Crocinitomicaceae bacterium]
MRNLILSLIALVTIFSNSAFASNEPTSIFQKIASKIAYPSSSIQNQEEGTVYVSFEINDENEITNEKIELGVSEDLNEAALNAVKNLTKEELKQLRVEEGNTLILPIRFRIL